MTATGFSLAHLSSSVLESLWQALRELPPTTRITEAHLNAEPLREAIGPLLGQPAWLLVTLVEAVLSERGTFSATSPTSPDPAALVEYRRAPIRSGSPVELVWSGATAPRSCARSTREAIEDLFSSVDRELFVAGYSFDHATDLFQPLARRAEALAAAGRPLPRVRVVLDCSRKAGAGLGDRVAIAHAVRDDFLRGCWTPTLLRPELRYLPASAERTADGFASVSMHAKCIVVDRRVALVGSANFSNRGRDRNLEVGVVVWDHHFVQSLVAEWEALWPTLHELAVP